ncbi:MAG: hypothetical protein LBD57_04280 [Endomicrobium sp.]|jgi:phage-related protein|uniref:hypothetical protein n=1 Tax=Candidatus Endomicrobiellum cubanum TaxID=3242325 RepID=UPI002824FC06|nr:hypothetical protein [Endomicrobium sp.]
MATKLKYPFLAGGFRFNGKRSIDDYGLICKSVTRPLIPAVKFRRVELAGYSGSYDLDADKVSNFKNRFELGQITISVQWIGGYTDLSKPFVNTIEDNVYTTDNLAIAELYERGHKIAAWLSQPRWCPLSFIEDPTVTYYAKLDGAINVEYPMQGEFPIANTNINFVCQPFDSYSTPGSYSTIPITISWINESGDGSPITNSNAGYGDLNVG